MAKESVRVVVFNDDQGWCTTPFLVNTEDLCLSQGELDYSCHCWSWKLKTWDNLELKPCALHSGVLESKDPMEMYKIKEFMETPNAGNWATFYEDGTCYDLCWRNTAEAKKEIAMQAAIAKEEANNNIDKIAAFNPVLRVEEADKSHAEFLSIIESIKTGKDRLLELMKQISKIKITSNRFEREPLYMSYKKIVRRDEANVIDLRSQLGKNGLGIDVINKHPKVIEAEQLLKKSEEKLQKWTSKIGQAEIKKELDTVMQSYEAIGVQVSELEKNIKRDCIPYFYDVFEAYINSKENPRLKKKYLEYLKIYEEYLPQKIWAVAYRKRYQEKLNNDTARQAMNTGSLATRISTESEIKVSIVIGENGVEVCNDIPDTVIAGGAMANFNPAYKANTPERKPHTPERKPHTPEKKFEKPYRGRGKQTR